MQKNKRELNRLRNVFIEQSKNPHIDRGRYEVNAAALANGIVGMSSHTLRFLAEFICDERLGFGRRVDGRKNNIVLNSGVLAVLMEDRMDSIAVLRHAIDALQAISQTSIDGSIRGVLLSDMTHRWWSRVRGGIAKRGVAGGSGHVCDIDDAIRVLTEHVDAEEEIYSQMFAAELRAVTAAEWQRYSSRKSRRATAKVVHNE